MSTTPTPATTAGFFQHGSAEQARPQQAGTYVVTGIGDPKETASKLYWMADIITEPTRGSRKIFPSIMFRTEMFTPGFDPREYTDYVKNPNLNVIPEGKKITVGESLAAVCRMHVLPALPTDSKGNLRIDKKTGLPMEPREVPTMVAVCGGTWQNVINGLAPRLAAAFSTLGGRIEFSAEEIVAILRDQVRAQGKVEVAAVLKQATDRDGSLTDRYEIANWVGPFNDATNERLRERAQKSEADFAAGKIGQGRKLQIGYRG